MLAWPLWPKILNIKKALEIILFLSIVTASVSFTIAETKLFKPLRDWIIGKSTFLGKLLNCGYCFGHWVALILVIIYKPRLFEFWWLLDYFLTALVIAWLGALQWIAMCWLMGKTGKWNRRCLSQKLLSDKFTLIKCQ